MIIIDTREQKADYVQKILQKHNYECMIAKLDYGDYSMPAQDVGIERKSIGDFIGSMHELAPKLAMLKKHYKIPMLMLEGIHTTNYHSGMITQRIGKSFVDTGTTHKAFYNFLLSLQCKGIVILSTNNLTETTYLLMHIYDYFSKEYHAPLAPKFEDTYDKQIFTLTMIEGISETFAGKLLKHFKTIYNIVNANTEELKKIEGIGNKKARAIYEYFRRKNV